MGILDLLNEPLLLRLRIVTYAVLVFFSFFIFIGAAVMKDDYRYGKCPLYSDTKGGEDGSVSSCNYPMAIGIIFQLLYLLFRLAILILFFLGKFNKDMFFFSDVMELVFEIIDCIAFFLTFIGACVLSAGHNSACDGRNGYYCDHQAKWISPSRAAQAGAWISTFAWLFVAIVGFLTLMRAGKIPCLGGGASGPSSGSGQAAPDGGQQPPMQTPPSNPDDMPKY